jgi:formate hydrogenlyase subunit 6/NADH:ubiquinone oxidoreductase subunit I/CBS domain-containing protein
MSMWLNTLKNLFSKPATRLYPAVPAALAEDTRGRIVYQMDKCIFCGLCERRCPTNAITMDKANKRQIVSRARCIACGVCVENCPTDAIDMRREYAPPSTAPELHVYSTTLTEHQYTVLSLPPFERGRGPPRPPSPPPEGAPKAKAEVGGEEGRITLDSPASSIMSIRVLTLYEDDTVRKALQIMVNQKIGGLPVVDINFKALGIITGTDVARAAGKEKDGILAFLFPKDGKKSDVAEEARLRRTMDKPVREIMTSPVITASPTTALRDIAANMGKNAFDRVPIADPDGRIVGIVTRRDILRAIASSIDACPS